MNGFSEEVPGDNMQIVGEIIDPAVATRWPVPIP